MFPPIASASASSDTVRHGSVVEASQVHGQSPRLQSASLYPHPPASLPASASSSPFLRPSPPPTLSLAALPQTFVANVEYTKHLVLIFVKVFGTDVEAATLKLDVDLSSTLGAFKTLLCSHIPTLVLQRLLYAGKLLNDDSKELSSLDLYKEATVQALVRNKTDDERKKDEALQLKMHLDSSANGGNGATSTPAKKKWSLLRRKVNEQFSPPPQPKFFSFESVIPTTYSTAQPPAYGAAHSSSSTAASSSSSSSASSSPPASAVVPSTIHPLCLNFGEAFFIEVHAARDLVGSSWLGGKIDPYVLTVFQGSTARSSIKKSTHEPVWMEILAMWRQLVPNPAPLVQKGFQRGRQFGNSAAAVISSANSSSSSSSSAVSVSSSPSTPPAPPSPYQRDRLHIIVFDHGYLGRDESLGMVEFEADSIPLLPFPDRLLPSSAQDSTAALSLQSVPLQPAWYKLQGGKGGELLLNIQRFALSSPQMHILFNSWTRVEKPLSSLGQVSAEHAKLGFNMRSLRATQGAIPFNLPLIHQSISMDERMRGWWKTMETAIAAISIVKEKREALMAETIASQPMAITAGGAGGSWNETEPSVSLINVIPPRRAATPPLTQRFIFTNTSPVDSTSSTASTLNAVSPHATPSAAASPPSAATSISTPRYNGRRNSTNTMGAMLSSPLLHVSSAFVAATTATNVASSPTASSSSLSATTVATGSRTPRGVSPQPPTTGTRSHSNANTYTHAIGTFWNAALFQLEYSLLHSMNLVQNPSSNNISQVVVLPLSPLFTTRHYQHAVQSILYSQQLLLPLFPSVNLLPKLERFVWMSHSPVGLTAEEFHKLLTEKLDLPVERGSSLAIKTYCYIPAARLAYIVCANVEQSVLVMLRLRTLLQACCFAGSAQPSPNSTASPGITSGASNAQPHQIGPFFTLGRKLSPAELGVLKTATYAGLINVTLPTPPVTTTTASVDASATPRAPSPAPSPRGSPTASPTPKPSYPSFPAIPPTTVLLLLTSSGMLLGFDSIFQHSAVDENQLLEPLFAIDIAVKRKVAVVPEGLSATTWSSAGLTPIPPAPVTSFASASSAFSVGAPSPRGRRSPSPSPATAGLSASTHMVLLRTSPTSFEIAMKNHTVVYRFQLQSHVVSSSAAARNALVDSNAAHASAVLDLPVYGFDASYLDGWMKQLKSWRSMAPTAHQTSIAAGDESPRIHIPSSLDELPSVPMDDTVSHTDAFVKMCDLCSKEWAMEHLYRLDADTSSGFTCQTCLQSQARLLLPVKSATESAAVASRGINFSTMDLVDLLTPAEYSLYVDSSTQTLLAPPIAPMSTATPSLLGSISASPGPPTISSGSRPSTFTQCPSCSARIVVDASASSSNESALQDEVQMNWWKKQTGVDGKPPTAASYLHFLQNRILCRSGSGNCTTNFCLSCNATPYHIGLDCADFAEFQLSPKCRFCLTSAVTKRNHLVGPPSKALEQVCGDAECERKSRMSCLKFHHGDCTHFCYGVRNEATCLPCIDPECVAAHPVPTSGVDAESDCAVCFTENIGQAPALQLGCGHLLHYACILERIRSNWTGDVTNPLNEAFLPLSNFLSIVEPANAPPRSIDPRIHFTFLNCPLCSRRLEHPALDGVMKPYVTFEAQVHARAKDKFKEEQLGSHEKWSKFVAEYSPPVVPVLSRSNSLAMIPDAVYVPPTAQVAFALEQLNFYQCFQCKKPYFAGARECGPADQGVMAEPNRLQPPQRRDGAANGAQGAASPVILPSDLLCSACRSQSSYDNCEIHGSDWIMYKCRFCCSLSTYCCWDSTHFCDSCHHQDEWPNLCAYATGKNEKPLYDYPQCPGLANKIALVLKDKSLKTVEAKEEAISGLYSDPETCPLGVRHAPNGIEFGLGCAMCRDQKAEAENKKKAEERFRVLEERRHKLKVRLMHLIPHEGTNKPPALSRPTSITDVDGNHAVESMEPDSEMNQAVWLLPEEVIPSFTSISVSDGPIIKPVTVRQDNIYDYSEQHPNFSPVDSPRNNEVLTSVNGSPNASLVDEVAMQPHVSPPHGAPFSRRSESLTMSPSYLEASTPRSAIQSQTLYTKRESYASVLHAEVDENGSVRNGIPKFSLEPEADNADILCPSPASKLQYSPITAAELQKVQLAQILAKHARKSSSTSDNNQRAHQSSDSLSADSLKDNVTVNISQVHPSKQYSDLEAEFAELTGPLPSAPLQSTQESESRSIDIKVEQPTQAVSSLTYEHEREEQKTVEFSTESTSSAPRTSLFLPPYESLPCTSIRSCGLIDFLATDNLSRNYVNPFRPPIAQPEHTAKQSAEGASAASSSFASASSGAATATGEQLRDSLVTYLCDLTMSSIQGHQQVPWIVYELPSPAAAIVDALSERARKRNRRNSADPSQPENAVSIAGSVPRMRSAFSRDFPLSWVCAQFHHLALQPTHYAIYVPTARAVKSLTTSAREATQARAIAMAALSARAKNPKKVFVVNSSGNVADAANAVAINAMQDANCFLMSWRLEGSNAGVQWDVLDEQFASMALAPSRARSREQEEREKEVKGAPSASFFNRLLGKTDSAASSSLSVSSPAAVLDLNAADIPHRRVLFSIPHSLLSTLTGSSSSNVANGSSMDTKRYTQFRLIQTDFNSIGCHILPFHGLELFGRLVPAVSDQSFLQQTELHSLDLLRRSLLAKGNTFTISGAGIELTPGLEVSLFEHGRIVQNMGSAKWRAIRVESPMVPSKQQMKFTFHFQILHDPPTSNSWHFNVGLIDEEFQVANRCWIGAQKNSFGYIAGTGGICHASGISKDYGQPYGSGDLISIVADFAQGTIEFFLNRRSQGIAFHNLDPLQAPYYPAVSLHAVRAQVKFIPDDELELHQDASGLTRVCSTPKSKSKTKET